MKNLNNKNKKLKFGFAVGIFIVTIIISLLALYYIHQFAMDRNWAVTRLFVHCPFHLRYLLILLGSILLSLLPVILLNMRRTWRKRILNKEVLWFLRSYIAVNPTGSRYIAVRHIGHGIAGLLLFWLPLLLKAVIPPISKASKYLYKKLIRRTPITKTEKKTPTPDKPSKTMKIATHHQSHYEAFLLHELKGAETETRQIEMATRAIHLYEQQGGDAPQTAAKVLDTMKNAIKAMKKEFSLLTALSDYLVCPKCKEKESPDVPYPGSKIYRAFYRGGLSHRRLWGIIERTDMFCSRLRLLLSLLSTLEGTESYYLERALKKNYHQIKKRLVKYYKLFRHEISTAPGLDETVKEFLTALTDFRLELLEKNRDDAQTDSWILKRRIQVTGTPMKNTLKDTKRNAKTETREDNPNYFKLAVRTLSLEYYLNRDWQGIIEFYRLLAVKNKYEPGTDDYIDLGEAYWQYAKELGAGPPGKWAANQSLKYYYRASGGEHLERYTTPFNENKKGEVNR